MYCVLRLVGWYDLAGEYLSNYRIDQAFLTGSFPVMVPETGGMPSFSNKVVRLEEKPPGLSCSFRIEICVLIESSYSSKICIVKLCGFDAVQVLNSSIIFHRIIEECTLIVHSRWSRSR